MHLTLVRHGECLGQSDPEFWSDPDSPLSKRRVDQATLVAQRLAMEQVNHVFSSPLLRALATAEVIATACSLSQFQVWTELREGFRGQYIGWNRARIQSQFPRTAPQDDMAEAGWQHGDEQYAALWARCEAVVDRIREQQYGQNDHVVLVTHGGRANYLLHVLLGLAPTEPRWFELDNGSISRVRLVPDPVAERPDWPLYPPIPVEV